MDSLIKWSDEYLLGIDEIDQQHKHLFELINIAHKSGYQLFFE